MPPAFGNAIYYFVIGQNGPKCGAPVYFGFGEISETVLQEYFLLLFLIISIPHFGSKRIDVVVANCVYVFISLYAKNRDQCVNRFGFIGFFVVPRVKQFNKNPLGPFVIVWIGSAYFTTPIKRKSNTV